jgi:outer membrane protein assembly factor BamB
MGTRTFVAYFVAAFLALPLTASGQSATLISETVWGTPGHEGVEGIAVGPDGSTYLTGIHNLTAPPLKIFLVKFGPGGSLAWQLTWDGPDPFADSLASDVAVSPDGAAVYVTGTSFINPNLGVLLKFNTADGSLVWQKSWGGSAFPKGVAVDADGSIYVGGSVRLNFDANVRASLTKFAADGNLLWHRIWNTPTSRGETSGEDVALDGAGNVYLAGGTPIEDPADPDFLLGFQVALLKVDASGTLLWQRTVAEGEQLDARGGLATAPDGSVYIVGGRSDDRRFSFDALIVKFSPDGTLVWNRAWGGRGHDEAGAVVVRPDGAVFVTGTTNSFSDADDVFFLHLQPESGRAEDAATWGGPITTDVGNAIAFNATGDAVIGATVQDPPYVFDGAPTRTSRLRTTVGDPAFPLAPLDVANVDAGGTVEPIAGTTNDDPGGHFDAAVIVIRP